MDEWITKPKKEDVEIDTTLIKTKSEEWMKMIDDVINDAEDEDSLETSKEIINKFKDKLKKYRTRGLEDGGEFSNENLVFKVLRRNGYIQKLFDFQTKHVDKNLSLKERYIY
jgi:sugar-specific transcriptional regulator TrmB